MTDHHEDGEIIDPTDAQLADDDVLAVDLPEDNAEVDFSHVIDDPYDSVVDAFADDLDADDLEVGDPDVDDPDADRIRFGGEDHSGLDRDVGAGLFDEQPDVADFTVADSGEADVDVGVYDPSPLLSLLGGDLGGDDFAAMIAVLGLDVDDLDARDSVRLLDALGVDARVEYGSIDRLVDVVVAGGDLRVSSEGATYAVEQFDDLRDTAVLRDVESGARYELPLEAFEDGWAAAANEMIVAPGEVGGTATVIVAVPLATALQPIALDL